MSNAKIQKILNFKRYIFLIVDFYMAIYMDIYSSLLYMNKQF